jgi:hypothetical protein
VEKMIYKDKENIKCILNAHGITTAFIKRNLTEEQWRTINKKNPVAKVETKEEEEGNALNCKLYIYLNSPPSDLEYVNFTFKGDFYND